MKKLLTILFLSTLIIQFSCKGDPVLEETTSVQLVFKGKYGAETFLINKEYTFDNQPIQFDQFNFYVGKVVLIKEIVANREETELVEVDFVDLSFKPADAADAEKGFVLNIPNVPVGEYSGIEINIGVPSDLNKTKPEEYGAGHPLRNVGHYWAAWESFIFSKTEARIDVDNDGSFGHKLAYHTGSDEAYRTRFYAQNITLEKDVTTNVAFEIDVKKIFDGVDVMTQTGTHNIGDLTLVNKVMDNLEDALLAE